MRVIGLDLSTSTIGYCVIETHAPFRPKVDYAIVEMNHFSLKNVEGLFNKVDIGFDAILKVMIRLGVQQAYIEEPVQAFTPGMSSAATIILLAKFKALISYHVRNHLGDANLFYVKPTEARKTCSLVMTTKAKAGGKSQKEQVFEQLTAPNGLLSHVKFELTKTGKQKPENYDRADAFVVAYHGAVKAL